MGSFQKAFAFLIKGTNVTVSAFFWLFPSLNLGVTSGTVVLVYAQEVKPGSSQRS